MTTTYLQLPQAPAKHLVLFNVEGEILGNNSEINGLSEYDGAEVLSAWELVHINSEMPGTSFADTEENIAAQVISSKIKTAAADRSIYKKYCPVCRSRGVISSDDIYTCPKCTSSYMFSENDENVKVWFRKIRK